MPKASVINAVARPSNAPMIIEIGSAMRALSKDNENRAFVVNRPGVCTRYAKVEAAP